MQKQYKVKLKAKEGTKLKQMVNRGQEKARKITRCRILLLSDQGKTNQEIAEALDVSLGTIITITKRYVSQDLEAAINERRRSGAPKKFTGNQKAQITAIACSEPPEGRSRWSLRLLADKVVELDIVEDVSYKTIERTLKKTN